jgi:hypothetical protein
MSFLRIAKRLRARLPLPEDEEEPEQPHLVEVEDETPAVTVKAASHDEVTTERVSLFTDTHAIETPRIGR